MSKKNKYPILSKLDMGPIYKEVLLALRECDVTSFLIFEDQPFDIKQFILPYGNTLIYLNNCENIVDRVIRKISQGIYDEDYPEFLIHSLFNEEVALLYKIAIILSEMLDIPCPQIDFRDFYEGYGEYINDINLVVLHTDSELSIFEMFIILAHEFRHAWQYKYHPDIINDSISYKENLDEYFLSPEELDAQAFATKLWLDVSGDNLLETKEYAMGNTKVKKKTQEIMDTIVLDEKYVYKLKALLLSDLED